jgi:hypothetical protein
MLKKGMIVLGTLLAAASFCFAQGTTEKKTEVKDKQRSASSGKEIDSVVQQRISNIVTYIETLQEK